MIDWSVHHLHEEAKKTLGNETALCLKQYALILKRSNLPVIFTLRHLANIVDIDYRTLRATVDRHREFANYRMYAIKKRSGGRRHIHALSKKLLKTHQFINSEILQNVQPHYSSFAYHPKGGIEACAQMHCGARWLFQYDLKDFFYSVNESDVYKIFVNLGYRPLLAFELARICTTLRLPKHLNKLLILPSCPQNTYKYYQSEETINGIVFERLLKMGVLTQGSPASPMLANLVARELDEELTEFAYEYGFVYTRYADDITLSCSENFSEKLTIGKIHSQVVRIIRKHNFKENRQKTRIAGPGSKKIVLGLLVDDDSPRLSKETYKRIDRHLYSIEKFGLAEVARYNSFDSMLGYYNHVAGLIAFVKDVDENRWIEFSNRFESVKSPLELPF